MECVSSLSLALGLNTPVRWIISAIRRRWKRLKWRRNSFRLVHNSFWRPYWLPIASTVILSPCTGRLTWPPPHPVCSLLSFEYLRYFSIGRLLKRSIEKIEQFTIMNPSWRAHYSVPWEIDTIRNDYLSPGSGRLYWWWGIWLISSLFPIHSY